MYCSLRRARHMSPLMGLRASKGAIDCVALQMRRVEIRVVCPGARRTLNRLDLPRYDDYEGLRKLRFTTTIKCVVPLFPYMCLLMGAFTGRRKDLGRSEEL